MKIGKIKSATKIKMLTWILTKQLQPSEHYHFEQRQHHDRDEGKSTDYIERLCKGQKKQPAQ